MAKGKKTGFLKITILPEEKQPFTIPDNWLWMDIDSINHYSGFLVDPMKQPDTIFELYSVTSCTNNYPEIITGLEIGSTKRSVEKNDVLLCKINPRINRVWKVSPHTKYKLIASSEWIIVRNAVINSDYLMYCFKTPYFREFMLSNVSGVGGSLMRAQPKFVNSYPIPIAPLSEQQRIVDRIESLFAKLDEAKEKAQAVVDGFENRKASILHKAFIGELTMQWRQKNNVGLDSWQYISIEKLCHSLKYGTAKKSQSQGPVVVIRMGNLQHGEIDWSNLAYTDDKEDIEKYKLSPGDILFNRTNSPELVGKTSIYRGEYPAIYAGYLIKLDYNHDQIVGDYLNYVLNSPSAKEYCSAVKTDGVNQSNINAKKIGAFIIPIPTISEQKEIINIVNSIFAKEQKAKEMAEDVLEQVEIIKKSILAKAFRGELGTNDPNEESAVALLKTIL